MVYLIREAVVTYRKGKALRLWKSRIESHIDIERLLRRRMARKDRETMVALFLDSQNHPVGYMTMEGGDGVVLIDQKSVVRAMLLCGATKLVLVHNHPDGGPPSRLDIDMTRRIRTCLALFNMELVDHLVMVPGGSIRVGIDHRPRAEV